MLIATQATSVTGTQKYFEQVLTRGDYYLGQEVAGQWHGKGTTELGLSPGANVTKEQFSHLLQGRHIEPVYIGTGSWTTTFDMQIPSRQQRIR